MNNLPVFLQSLEQNGKIVHCSLVTGCFWHANRFHKYLPLILPNVVLSRLIMITCGLIKSLL